MKITSVMENFIGQVRQNEHIVSADYAEATQAHMTQIERTDVVVVSLVIKVDDTEHVPVDFVVPVDAIVEDSYTHFSSGLELLMHCDCVVVNEKHNDRLMRDINQSAFNNIGRTTYFIRPSDGWMVPIYGEYADEIVPTDPVFLQLIEKLKNVEHVLEVKVEKLLDDSILTVEERQFVHVFFRIKHTIVGTTDERYAHFIMSEPSCCNELEHPWAIEQLTNLIAATPV